MNKKGLLSAFMIILLCSEVRGDATLAIGEQVTFEDSTWVVLSAHEIGDQLVCNNEFGKDLHSPDGKYIYVKYKVTNERNEEEAILITPAVQDSRGRRYEELENLNFYLNIGDNQISGTTLPAGLGKTFGSIFEMPKNSEGVVFLARSLDILKTEKAVALELEATKRRELEQMELAKKREREQMELAKRQEAEELEKTKEEEKKQAAKTKEENDAELVKIDERLNELRLIIKQDTDRINQLTNFKRTPVREGSREHLLCIESAKRIEISLNEGRGLKEKKKTLSSSQ